MSEVEKINSVESGEGKVVEQKSEKKEEAVNAADVKVSEANGDIAAAEKDVGEAKEGGDEKNGVVKKEEEEEKKEDAGEKEEEAEEKKEDVAEKNDDGDKDGDKDKEADKNGDAPAPAPAAAADDAKDKAAGDAKDGAAPAAAGANSNSNNRGASSNSSAGAAAGNSSGGGGGAPHPSGTGANLPSYASSSLYVGDLGPDVTEGLLFELFNAVAPVSSIRVCRDAVTRRSLGYAYVNFHSVADAERVMETMNTQLIAKRPCRIMWSQRDPSMRKSGAGNIFIKNLDKSIDHKTLSDTFSLFGNILSCKVVLDEHGVSKGYGFIHYDNEESAKNAIEKVNGMELADRKVEVSAFKSRKERLAMRGDPRDNFTNVYVKNLPDAVMSEEDLRNMFEPYGTITSVYLKRGKDDKPLGFGFVNFETNAEAKAAVAGMNNKENPDEGKPPLFVGRAQKKSERQQELRNRMDALKQERANKHHGLNVYIKSLDDSVDDDKLRELFSPFGTITSAKVMRDDKMNSRGFGFVSFDSPDSATKAVTELNGVMVAGKPIYVALAQRKEVRRAHLEAQHARRGKAGPQGPPPQMIHPGAVPMYAPAGGIFYANQQPFMYPQAQFAAAASMAGRNGRGGGWAPPVPPQAFGMPGQYMLPMAQARNGGQMRGRGGRRGRGRGAPTVGIPDAYAQQMAYQQQLVYQQQAQAQAQAAVHQQQMHQQHLQQQAAAQQHQHHLQQQGAAQHQQQVVQQAPPQQVLQHQQLAQLAQVPLDAKTVSSLAPEQQKILVGEKLYPLIAQAQPELAGKITGMLLDSYFTEEIIHLIETPDALNVKIQEALHVLEAHSKQQLEQQQR